ncbi:MAG: hypothetical protein AAGA21_24730 [Pseudomonadota bacterium]
MEAFAETSQRVALQHDQARSSVSANAGHRSFPYELPDVDGEATNSRHSMLEGFNLLKSQKISPSSTIVTN